MTDPLLTVTNLSVHYGGVMAVRDVSFDVRPGECSAILGANGAGKSSILRALSGLTSTSRSTEVTLAGARIERISPERRARMGLGHVLEGRHIFPRLSVDENLELGRQADPDRTRRRQSTTRDLVMEVFPDLRGMLDRKAAMLSGGQQQFLAIARAMMGNPSLLLLDEPTVGLAPRLIEQVADVIDRLLESGTTVLLVEQSLEVVVAVAGEVHLLSHGEFVAQTTGRDPHLAAVAHQTYLS